MAIVFLMVAGASPTWARHRPSWVAPGGMRKPVELLSRSHDRSETLRKQLNRLVQRPLVRKLRLGLTVADVRSGTELFALNPESSFNPASNTKIFTTAAALSILGTDFRFRTALWSAAPRLETGLTEVAQGPFFLQGSGDPSFQTADILDLVRNLVHRGFRVLNGDILFDGDFRDESDFEKQVEAPAYGSNALMLNRGVFRVRVFPGSVGKAASVQIEPPSPFFVTRSAVKTVPGKRSKLSVETHYKDGQLVVEVRGRIGKKRDRLTLKHHVPNHREWMRFALATALREVGIEHRGEIRLGVPPKGPLHVVAEHRSQPLSEICRVINKDSNNFVADVVWKTLGSAQYGLPQSLDKGARAVTDWLTPMGFQTDRLRLVNGSGLTYENRVRPADVSKLLTRLFHSLDIGPEFVQSLAVGGVDGTIHHRFRGMSSGLVKGKTGTLNGVSVLSGYVGSHPGVLVFTIFVEGFKPRRLPKIRQFQAQIVELLLAHIRSGPQRAADLPASGFASHGLPETEEMEIADEEPL